MNYNKDEVMKAFVTKFPHDTLGYYADHAPADTHSPEDGSCLQCPVQCSYTEDIASFLSTALDSAYKAGRESMYQAGGKACKKVYQNHKEDHLCRFNDGEQNCNCYLSGINEVIVALEALK